jgi:hypothetical protein
MGSVSATARHPLYTQPVARESPRHRGLPKVDWQFTVAMAAYDLLRLAKSLAQPPA